MPEKEVVTPDDWLAVAKDASIKLTGPQRAAFLLAVATFVLIATCSAGVLWATLRDIPPPPAQPTAMTAEMIDLHAKQIANHAAIRSETIDGAVKLFQTVVVAALLPVLMTTLGYMFGRGERS